MSPEDPSKKLDLEDSPGGGEALTMEQINTLLNEEDPRFVEGLNEIGDLEAPEGVKIELLGLEEEGLGESSAAQEKKGRSILSFAFLKRWAQALNPADWKQKPGLMMAGFRQGLKSTTGWVVTRKNKVRAYFRGLNPRARQSLWFMFFCLMAIAGSLASFGKLDFKSFLQAVEVTNLADVAGEVFTYDESGPRESFFSPMKRPDAYILVKGIVVQLRPTAAHPRAKLFVEFIIDASSQRAALEVQKMEVSLRDKLARAMEDFTYDELRTIKGKDRLRETIKSHVDAALTTGYIRSVFFQKFLLH